MAHDPSLGYADYFAAANASAVNLMPAMDVGAPELFGFQAGMEMFGMRGLAAVPGAMGAASAHSKAVLVDGGDGIDCGSTFRFLGEPPQHHHQPSHAPLSLSLCRAEGGLTHHHQLGAFTGSSSRQQTAGPWPHGAWHLRSSKFLLPAQQLLQEFCSLPVDITKPAKTKPPHEDGGAGGSSSSTSWTPSPQIQKMDAAELQKLKAKLYAMLEEVDRRYRRYCEQMQALAGAFEAVAGDRAAAVYTAVAARTISRHFRSLRDGIVAQIQAARKALGEKDVAVPGMTKGETPRLRLLDQCLRQQKALHQPGMLENHPWRPQRGLPERAVSILRAWLFEHFLHPYPSDVDKHVLARQTGLSRSQVSNWFINARVRLWKPMVEEMYLEEMKGQDRGEAPESQNPNPSSYAAGASKARGGHVDDDGGGNGDQKPTRAQLLHDVGSLASVVNITGGGGGVGGQSFGIMDHLDFEAYGNGGGGQGFRTGVSLTLGLQQHDTHDDGSTGVNVAFAAPPAQGGGGFLFPGEQHMESSAAHSGHVHLGMEGEASHGQVHYRGLSTGFQMLHDLAG